MGLISYALGQTSVVLRVKIIDSSTLTGGKTGLTSATSGLIISTIADNAATAVTYTVAGSTIETITTLGTYAAPTATKCRFKEVDATNHKGVYEIQLADARFAVASSKSLLVSITGATGACDCDVVIPLTVINMYATTVPMDQTRVLGTARDVSGVADSSITIADALWAAVGAGVGKYDVTATPDQMTVKSPSTATLLRTFTLDSTSAPTYRH